MDLEEKIKRFAESTMLEEYNRYPGMRYASIERYNTLTNAQLQFNIDTVKKYYNECYLSTTEEIDALSSIKEMQEELDARQEKLTTPKWPYIDSPYFSLSEMAIINEHEVNGTGRPEHIEFDNNHMFYGEKIRDLELELKRTEDPEEISKIKKLMKALGWNPEVEYSESNIVKAAKRITKLHEQEMSSFCNFVDISDDINTNKVSYIKEDAELDNTLSEYSPIFICCSEDASIRISNRLYKQDYSSEVYAVFFESGLTDNIIFNESNFNQFTNLDSYDYFVMPNNYRIYQVVRNIYEAYQLYGNPVIYKLKSEYETVDNKIIRNKCASMCNNIIPESAVLEIDYKVYLNAVICGI